MFATKPFDYRCFTTRYGTHSLKEENLLRFKQLLILRSVRATDTPQNIEMSPQLVANKLNEHAKLK